MIPRPHRPVKHTNGPEDLIDPVFYLYLRADFLGVFDVGNSHADVAVDR
jgi:hypothetical protein